MKKILIVIMICALLIPMTPKSYSKEPVWQQNSTVSFSGGKRTINAVYVNLNDKTIRMEAALAKNQVGQVDDLKNIAEQLKSPERQVIGAINGTFFNAYSDFQPSGTIQTKGEYVHIGQTGTVIGFKADNSFVMENLYTYINGSINGSNSYPNNWSAWGFNHKYDSTNSTIVFTPAFGKNTGKHSKTSILIDHGKVTKISSGEAIIPENGYTLVTGEANLVKRFSLGDKIGYRLDFFKSIGGKKGTAIDWENTRTTIGAGPTLVRNGKVYADGKTEGFTEDKINKNRAQRSFAGVTKNNILILGTVSNVTLKELAEILKNMGIVNGMNLDGGASSSLYFKGKYVTTPGRKLSNALVITKLKEQPIRVQINSKDIFYKYDPYFTKSGLLMVPLKETFEYFDSEVYMKNSNRSITVKRYNKTYEFTTGSDIVTVNQESSTLPSPIENKNGQNYVPLHFIVDCLDGELNWNKSLRTAAINAKITNIDEIFQEANKANEAKNFTLAEDLYSKIIEMDSNHIGALLKLAALSFSQKNYEMAINCYVKYLEIKPKDLQVTNSLGWAYYNIHDYTNAIETFKALTIARPDNAAYWITLGGTYAHYSVKQYEDAKKCFEKAKALNPTKSQLQVIQDKLQYIENLNK